MKTLISMTVTVILPGVKRWNRKDKKHGLTSDHGPKVAADHGADVTSASCLQLASHFDCSSEQGVHYQKARTFLEAEAYPQRADILLLLGLDSQVSWWYCALFSYS